MIGVVKLVFYIEQMEIYGKLSWLFYAWSEDILDFTKSKYISPNLEKIKEYDRHIEIVSLLTHALEHTPYKKSNKTLLNAIFFLN